MANEQYINPLSRSETGSFNNEVGIDNIRSLSYVVCGLGLLCLMKLMLFLIFHK
jgi:hypothetical protein